MQKKQLRIIQILFFAACCLTNSLAFSQEQIIKKEVKDKNGVTKFVKYQSEKGYKLTEAKSALKSTLNYADEVDMELIETNTDKLGMVHQKYQQTYKGLKVESAQYYVHSKTNEGTINTINGQFLPIENIDTTPTLSEDEALEAALEYVGANVYKWELASEEAFVKKLKGDETATYYPEAELLICKNYLDQTDTTLHLAYKFDIYAQTPTSRDYIYVDAESGEILWKNPIIKHLDENADTKYSGSVYIETTYTDSTYVLHDLTRGQGIFTYNLENSGNTLQDGSVIGINYNQASDFEDNDNNWTSEEWDNSDKDNAALDAHWGAMMTFDYFSTTHNRYGYDDAGAAMYLYVHAGTDYYNAYWDGEKMTFGDGYTTPLTTLDVTSHELGHAVMGSTADLDYSYEPGALNEGFSDIWAACVEYYAAPDKGIWDIGEELEYQIRSMSNPNDYEQPDTYLGDYWYEGSDDYGGVHINSGVLNHWFYLLSVGKTGENDLGSSYEVTGIGIENAALIAYRTLTVYLTSSSDFEATAIASIQAAEDLFGEDSEEYAQTVNAWYAVGIGGASFSADLTSFCESTSITFTDESMEAVSWSWIFEGGTPSTSTEQNPTVVYEEAGSYDVTLIMTNSFGFTDTLTQTDYIQSYMTDVTESEFETDLEDEDYASSWYTLNANNDSDVSGNAFQWNYINTTEGNARSGTGYFSYYGSSNRTANDWLFTSCLKMEAGKVYDISFWYRQRDSGSSQNLTLYLMSDLDANSIVEEITDLSGISNTEYADASGKVSVESSGIYYLAWHITSSSNQGNFYIDDIAIDFAADYDATVADIDLPSECDLSANTEITIPILNNGNKTLENLVFTYQILALSDSTVLADQTVTIDSLTPGETYDYVVEADLSTSAETYSVSASVELEEDVNTDDNTASASVTNYSIASEITITQDDLSLVAPDGYESYQWYNNSSKIYISGSSQTYSPSTSGEYIVTVSNEYGCSATSTTYTFSYTVTTALDDEIEGVNISLFPNPMVDEAFTIEISGSEVGTVSISLIDLQGHIIQSTDYQKSDYDFSQEIATSNLPSGIFLALITVNDKTIKEKVLKL